MPIKLLQLLATTAGQNGWPFEQTKGLSQIAGHKSLAINGWPRLSPVRRGVRDGDANRFKLLQLHGRSWSLTTNRGYKLPATCHKPMAGHKWLGEIHGGFIIIVVTNLIEIPHGKFQRFCQAMQNQNYNWNNDGGEHDMRQLRHLRQRDVQSV
jgi:hypothetical protein